MADCTASATRCAATRSRWRTTTARWGAAFLPRRCVVQPAGPMPRTGARGLADQGARLFSRALPPSRSAMARWSRRSRPRALRAGHRRRRRPARGAAAGARRRGAHRPAADDRHRAHARGGDSLPRLGAQRLRLLAAAARRIDRTRRRARHAHGRGVDAVQRAHGVDARVSRESVLRTRLRRARPGHPSLGGHRVVLVHRPPGARRGEAADMGDRRVQRHRQRDRRARRPRGGAAGLRRGIRIRKTCSQPMHPRGRFNGQHQRRSRNPRL